MRNLYLKNTNYKSISHEEKITLIKENKNKLSLTVDDLFLDNILYEIKNNWSSTGHQYSEMIDGWYNSLTN